jgi:filamentous hemagglutinin
MCRRSWAASSRPTPLAGGSARIILNEINSSNPTQLRGFVEVAGQRAEVIIANPAGVNVNGGGFINASRATLTTGSPSSTAATSRAFVCRAA